MKLSLLSNGFSNELTLFTEFRIEFHNDLNVQSGKLCNNKHCVKTVQIRRYFSAFALNTEIY